MSWDENVERIIGKHRADAITYLRDGDDDLALGQIVALLATQAAQRVEQEAEDDA